MDQARSGRSPRFVYLAEGPQSGPPTRAGWKLLAANNRPLGRAAQASESLADCLAAAELVHRDAMRSGRRNLVESGGGRWSWGLALDGAPVAVAVHGYLRRIECLRALDHFTEAADAADPAAGIVRHFGPRSLREFDVVAR